MTKQTCRPCVNQQYKTLKHGMSIVGGKVWSANIWATVYQQLSVSDLPTDVSFMHWTPCSQEIALMMMRPVGLTAHFYSIHTSTNSYSIWLLLLKQSDSCTEMLLMWTRCTQVIMKFVILLLLSLVVLCTMSYVFFKLLFFVKLLFFQTLCRLDSGLVVKSF